MPFRIASIVEGKGEVEALPVILRRLLAAYSPGYPVEILPPIRLDRSRMVKEDHLRRAVQLAGYQVDGNGAILILLDSDGACPAQLSANLKTSAAAAAWNCQCAVIVAHHEFEAWFLAAARSLAGYRGLPPDLEDHPSPESVRGAKEWLSARKGHASKYSEILDQPRLAARLDLHSARGAPSFDYFCRTFERLLEEA